MLCWHHQSHEAADDHQRENAHGAGRDDVFKGVPFCVRDSCGASERNGGDRQKHSKTVPDRENIFLYKQRKEAGLLAIPRLRFSVDFASLIVKIGKYFQTFLQKLFTLCLQYVKIEAEAYEIRWGRLSSEADYVTI